MKGNPIVPYIVIMIFGLAMIFFFSVKGIGDSEKIAKERDPDAHEEVVDTADFDPESYALSSCISCHGGDLTGGMGPSLYGLQGEEEEVRKIIVEGSDGGMPPNLVPAENLDQMVEWIMTLE